MHPFLFEIFGFKVYSYGSVMVTAFIFCFALALKYTPKNLLTHQDILNFCLLLIASLLFGTKLTGMFIHGDFGPQAWLNFLKFWQRGSFSFFPAVLLAISLIVIYCRSKAIPFLKTMDHLLPFAILAIGIQRTLGCFLAGCCYGKPTCLPWGIIFPGTSRAGSHFPGIPLHPTQLYYGIAAGLTFIFILWYKKKTHHEGEITALGLIMLAISYFFITFLRGDITADQVFYHLSHSQYLALILFTAGLFIIISHKGKNFSKPIGGTMKQIICLLLAAFLSFHLNAACKTENNTSLSQPPVKPVILTEKDLGSIANPIKCDKEKGEKEYLDKLKDMDGKAIVYERTGHFASKAGPILDKYEIKSEAGTVLIEIYMNMYCQGYTETKPVSGFQMDSPIVSSPSIPTQTNPTANQGGNVNSPVQSTTKNEDDKIPGFDDVPSPAVNGNPTSKNSQPAATPSNHGKQSNNGSPGTTITPSTTSTPGNNTGAEDKIPGFDDVQSSSNARPSTSASASTPKPPAAKNSPPPPGKIYISFLSLPVKNEADKTKSLPILLNETIGKGIKTVVNNNKQLAVNESKHTIHDNDAVEKDLTALLARTDLKENQKAEKIIDDIMTPHGIHCIYTAQLSGIGPDNIVNLHLYAISKTRKKMFTTNLIFQKDELICEDAGTKKPVLCPEAVKNITNTVQPLLEQAVK